MMEISETNFFNIFFIFLIIFFLLLFLIFLYTQIFIEKKQFIIINDEGKKIVVSVEVANDSFKHARGLMFRDKLGEHEGMLFVFEKPGKYGFWMVNTTIPLDAIFFNENKKVVEVITMEPCKSIVEQCKIYYPQNNALYVLEINKGFAAKNKIGNKSSFIFDG